jgi:transposase InsO family protein
VAQVVQRGLRSERKACVLLKVNRSAVRYRARPRTGDDALRERIRVLAHRRRRFGYRRIAVVLNRDEGMRVNVKRVHRLWKEEGLGLKRRRPKRRFYGPKGAVVNRAQRPGHVWTYDFVEDRTARGGKLKLLCVVDEFTRQCHAIRVEKRMGSHQVIETLDWLFALHGRPEHMRSDNGPEFIAHAVQHWLAAHSSQTIYIRPGSPWQNAYIESFNDKLRNECLNMEVFANGREARQVIETWRRDYNEQRPHSSLGYLTPDEFTARWRNSSRPTASLRSTNANKPVVNLSL